MPKRKLENSKQRPAPASLTNGNVGDTASPGNDTPTERFELLNPETRDWRLIFIAERSGLPRRLERHCRHAEIRADWPHPGSCPAGDGCHCGALVVTAPGAVATEKDPQMFPRVRPAAGPSRLFRRARKVQKRSDLRRIPGWGTWIRTKIDGVRVRADRSVVGFCPIVKNMAEYATVSGIAGWYPRKIALPVAKPAPLPSALDFARTRAGRRAAINRAITAAWSAAVRARRARGMLSEKFRPCGHAPPARRNRLTLLWSLVPRSLARGSATRQR